MTFLEILLLGTAALFCVTIVVLGAMFIWNNSRGRK